MDSIKNKITNIDSLKKKKKVIQHCMYKVGSWIKYKCFKVYGYILSSLSLGDRMNYWD